MDIITGSYCLEKDASPGLSQSSNLSTNGDNGDNHDDIFADIDGIPLDHESQEAFYVRNPYGYLKPYFSQMINCLEGHITM